MLRNITILFFILLFQSCDTAAIYKSMQDIEDGKWFIKTTPTFDFEIADPTQNYNVYYYIRNTSAYPYYNLYLTRYLTDATGKQLSVRLEQVNLFDEKTGKPLGSGLGDIFEHKILGIKNYRFPAKGKYQLQLKQYMRQDPLPEILSVGIAVEKTQN